MNEQADFMRDSLVLVEALYNIALESEEAEIVRVAIAALTNSKAGLAYLESHPFTL